MNSSLRTSASGMKAQQQMIDVIAHNLANVNTTGFKRGRATFEDALYENLAGGASVEAPGQEPGSSLQIGRGVRLASVHKIHSQGVIESTARALDLAVEGEGFLQVLRPDGALAYTRDGSLSVSASGTLATNGGYPIAPEIAVPDDASQIVVSAGGIVTVTGPGMTNPIEVGRIELARFLNTGGLLAIGENQYLETPASGRPFLGYPQEEGFGRITQGALESSNVEIVQE
ncbi:MAG: flagellar basal-body rod protein FlgG, partial [Candidatus Eisenbacteria bacterium]|nr:flagellar basal-body rod protein FlgG [Candidatus Latescibacterota bacterium]MBD3302457.1 flagellar basal-body rod protein FlgG [Candidatus Eisenbacteria bacterium]